ncbi:hypothetical protein P692DRAFT_20746282 [Suillus brevipes Sb2]|nr:hypothetical protein P692DRAFT_20746282 [Suillus brevipes Sb2]
MSGDTTGPRWNWYTPGYIYGCRTFNNLDIGHGRWRLARGASPALPEYLNNIVKMLTEWQVGLLDNKGLFHTFLTSWSDIVGNLMSWYRVVSTFAYSWWKDRFDLIPFEMPHRITLEEVQELYLAHASQMVSDHFTLGCPDPLIVNLRGLQDDLEMLGNHLQSWLSRKTDEGRVTLEVMARLEGLISMMPWLFPNSS